MKKFKPFTLLFCALMTVLSFSPTVQATQDLAQHNNESNVATEPSSMRPVQAFDIQAGKVVKTIPNDEEIQQMAKSWVDSVTSLSPKVTNDNSCSYVFRIPLQEPATIKAGEISIVTADLFLFYCKNEAPLILAFDGQRKPYLFLFSTDISPFLNKVDIH